mmetsp:Transcript_37561/g.77095  ORF Transcript_37561/g.77095 Transcript_37561/m.77095 type:complete len:206 (+) Transcript_37561:1963-2580(+)
MQTCDTPSILCGRSRTRTPCRTPAHGIMTQRRQKAARPMATESPYEGSLHQSHLPAHFCAPHGRSSTAVRRSDPPLSPSQSRYQSGMSPSLLCFLRPSMPLLSLPTNTTHSSSLLLEMTRSPTAHRYCQPHCPPASHTRPAIRALHCPRHLPPHNHSRPHSPTASTPLAPGKSAGRSPANLADIAPRHALRTRRGWTQPTASRSE